MERQRHVLPSRRRHHQRKQQPGESCGAASSSTAASSRPTSPAARHQAASGRTEPGWRIKRAVAHHAPSFMRHSDQMMARTRRITFRWRMGPMPRANTAWPPKLPCSADLESKFPLRIKPAGRLRRHYEVGIIGSGAISHKHAQATKNIGYRSSRLHRHQAEFGRNSRSVAVICSHYEELCGIRGDYVTSARSPIFDCSRSPSAAESAACAGAEPIRPISPPARDMIETRGKGGILLAW